MGFFRKEELQLKNRIVRRSQCGSCKLWKNCQSPKMPVTGKGRKGIFVLGEAPGAQEDRKGVQFVGKDGQYLRRKLKLAGIDLDRDCWKHNAVPCRPTTDNGKNRKPTDSEIDYCRPAVLKELRAREPKLIILLGASALKSFLADRWKKDLGGINKWRGWAIPDKDFNTWVLPVFHPNFVRAEKNPVVETIFNNDIKNVKNYLNKSFPDIPDAETCCHLLKKKQDIEEYLTEILKYKATFAFDYETTGLKPHMRGHKIATVSMCWQNDKACAWEWKLTPIKLYRQIMEDPDIRKIAANMKMEDHWTTERARGIKIQGWLWDTMNGAHILDSRKGITSLKFDVYKRFGVTDYSSHLDQYLHSVNRDYGANSFNRIFDAPMEDLLTYNARDSFYTYHLAILQMKEMGVLK